MTRPSLVAIAVVLASLASVARAEVTPFVALEQAAETLDFVAMLDAAETAMASGTLGPRELVRLHQLVAMADTFGGNVAGARAAYARMLAIDPEARPDPSVPPRLRQPYDDAARERRTVRIRGSAQAVGDAIRIDVDDTLGIVTHVVVAYLLGDATVPIELSRRASPELAMRLPIAAPTTIRYRVELRDRFGNRWVEIGGPDALREGHLEPVPTSSEERRRHVVRSPWLWIGVGAVAIGSALAIGFGVAHDRPVRAITSVTF